MATSSDMAALLPAPGSPPISTLRSGKVTVTVSPSSSTPTGIGSHSDSSSVHHLEKEVGPLLFKGTADLFCAAAALTEMAGWMAHDGGDDGRAQQHFDRALRFA